MYQRSNSDPFLFPMGEDLLPPDVIPYRKKTKRGYKNMTICLGAICNNKNTIITVSDKATSDVITHFIEEGEIKYKIINSKAIILVAGLFSVGTIIMDKTIAEIEDNFELPQIFEKLKNTHLEFRKKWIQRKYFGVEEIDSEIVKNSVILSRYPDLFTNYEMKYAQNNNDNFNISYLLAGYNFEKPTIYALSSEGDFGIKENFGFRCIGAGIDFARPYLYNKYNINLSIEDTFYLLLKTKIHCERSFGIGIGTDMNIVERDRVVSVTNEELDSLSNHIREQIKVETKPPAEETTPSNEIKNKINHILENHSLSE